MYVILMLVALGADDLQADRDWFLSRRMYESQAYRGHGPDYYYKAKGYLDKLDPEDQRAFINAERLRSQQRLLGQQMFMEAQRMRIEQTRPKPSPPKIYHFNPYPQLHFGPYYHKPHYAHPYPNTRYLLILR